MDNVLYNLIGQKRPLIGYLDMAEARRSYRRILMRFHTDKNKAANSKFIAQSIIKAMEILSDERQRRAYAKYGKSGLNWCEENIQWDELMKAWELVKDANRQMREEIIRQKRIHEEEQRVKQREEENKEKRQNNNDDEGKTVNEQGPDSTTSRSEAKGDDQNTNDRPENPDKEEVITIDESSDSSDNDETVDQNDSKRNKSFEDEEPIIVSHMFRRGQLKFRLKWTEYGIMTWKQVEEVKTSHDKGLKDYMEKLKHKSPTKLFNIVKAQPELAEILRTRKKDE